MYSSALFSSFGFIQFPIQTGEIEANIHSLKTLLSSTSFPPNTLLVLPEMWASGFDYSQTLALAKKTPKIKKELIQLANQYHCYLAGSMAEERPNKGKPVNSLILVGPEGEIDQRPKQHLFSRWSENQFYSPGRACFPMQTPQGLLGGLVCYDLRFPELAREQTFAGARILVVPAQWPEIKIEHWRTLIQARAIENQVFIAAANGCGMSGKILLGGHSMLVAPEGSILAEAENEPLLAWANVDPELQKNLHKMFYPPAERPWRCDGVKKVTSLKSLLDILAAIRHQGSRIAFAHGCFDLLHAGHVGFLEQARRTGDCLVVGLRSDESVRRLRSTRHPVNKEGYRARVLAAMGCVDFIVIFEEETPIKLITALMPDILVNATQRFENTAVGEEEIKAAGGKVKRIPFEYDCSTKNIIERIRTM